MRYSRMTDSGYIRKSVGQLYRQVYYFCAEFRVSLSWLFAEMLISDRFKSHTHVAILTTSFLFQTMVTFFK